MSENNALKKKL